MVRNSFTNGFENANKKSLTEQVNDICKGRGTQKQKIDALIKLGVSECEARFIIPVYVRAQRKKVAVAQQEVFSYTFGVEIECVMNRDNFYSAAANENLPYHFENYNHTDNREYFKFVTDGSLTRTYGREGDPIECVSPILDGSKKGYDKLALCCNALNNAGAYVNSSTGLHVHIGVKNMTDTHYVNIFKNYAKLQGVINSFLSRSRRNNGYAHTIGNVNFDYCYTKDDVLSLLNNSRYYAVNPCSYGRHSTVEFRQHQGTTNFNKIKNWANFCAKLVAYSRENVLTEVVTSINDIPFLNDVEKAFFNRRKAEVNNEVEND